MLYLAFNLEVYYMSDLIFDIGDMVKKLRLHKISKISYATQISDPTVREFVWGDYTKCSVKRLIEYKKFLDNVGENKAKSNG